MKFVVVPYRKVFGLFNYDSYFRSIDAEIVNFNDENDTKLLKAKIENLQNNELAAIGIKE
jgi:hypothetical protein